LEEEDWEEMKVLDSNCHNRFPNLDAPLHETAAITPPISIGARETTTAVDIHYYWEI
jgi:hypothetical protein